MSSKGSHARQMNDSSDDIHHKQFRHWVLSLSISELQKALTFSFLIDCSDINASRGNTRSKERCFWMGDGSGGCINSHEHDLLLQMIDTQAPLPIPIHPRAVSFKEATKLRPTDGRNNLKRIYDDRINKPRLFQLIERHSLSNKNSSRIRKRSVSNKRETTTSSSQRFDVIAKKFILPWGDILSVGVTHEQRNCEKEVLLRTKFYENVSLEDNTMKSTAHYCSIDICQRKDQVSSSSLTTSKILQIFHLSSRGKFLNTPWGSNNLDHTYFAPWLIPTQEWFSLPMYLVSRFEVSLWKSFIQKKSSMSPCESLFHKFIFSEEKIWRDCILDAVRKSMIYNFRYYCKIEDFLVRDCIWYQIFMESFLKVPIADTENPAFNGIPITLLLDRVISISLIEIGSGVDRLKKSICPLLYETVVNASERSLLSSIEIDDTFLTKNNVKAVKKVLSKKKKKGKKKKGHSDSTPKESVIVDQPPISAASIRQELTIEGKDEAPVEKDDGGASKVDTIITNDQEDDTWVAPLSSPKSSSPGHPAITKHHNDNAIVALLVIDELVQNVFTEVGLESRVEEEEQYQMEGGQEEWNLCGSSSFTNRKKQPHSLEDYNGAEKALIDDKLRLNSKTINVNKTFCNEKDPSVNCGGKAHRIMEIFQGNRGVENVATKHDRKDEDNSAIAKKTWSDVVASSSQDDNTLSIMSTKISPSTTTTNEFKDLTTSTLRGEPNSSEKINLTLYESEKVSPSNNKRIDNIEGFKDLLPSVAEFPSTITTTTPINNKPISSSSHNNTKSDLEKQQVSSVRPKRVDDSCLKGVAKTLPSVAEKLPSTIELNLPLNFNQCDQQYHQHEIYNNHYQQNCQCINYHRPPGNIMHPVAYNSRSISAASSTPIHPPPCFVDLASISLSVNGLDYGEGMDGSYYYEFPREKSVFTEFFKEKEEKIDIKEAEILQLPSSTAASLASSIGEDSCDGPDCGHHRQQDEESYIIGGDHDNNGMDHSSASEYGDCNNSAGEVEFSRAIDPRGIIDAALHYEDHRVIEDTAKNNNNNHTSRVTSTTPSSLSGSRHSSPSTIPPISTPPPQLSPLLVSLTDLGELRRRAASEQASNTEFVSLNKVVESLPNSPVREPTNNKILPKATLKPSWSREDLRVYSINEGNRTKHSQGSKSLYQRQLGDMLKKGTPTSAVVPTRRPILARTTSSSSCDFHAVTTAGSSSGNNTTANEVNSLASCSQQMKHLKQQLHQNIQHNIPTDDDDLHLVNACALSESALANDINDNVTTGTTTISSSAIIMNGNHHPACSDLQEDVSVLREERNGYRDMCLTLGAEVAKLRNMLSCEVGASFYPCGPFVTPGFCPQFRGPSSDPEFMPPFYQQYPSATRTYGAMSDVGIQRFDHESIRSEEGTDIMAQGSSIGGTDSTCMPPWVGHCNNSRVSVSNGTPNVAGSDVASVDNNCPVAAATATTNGNSGVSGFRPPVPSSYKDRFWMAPCHGLQSRLSKDIYSFQDSISGKLQALRIKRATAIKRISQIVTALWPRAQVNLYGSHVTNLCLPSSDLDFVICLPAVHKNAPAVAPGVLEGRNAINETWQKVLARKLKGESWLDPRSIQLIERTIVPVIKVSTKDTRAHVLRLDISFDGHAHHGLEAVNLVTHVMDELPVIRPLVLILKQFLLDRGLLTAFTGGISSYCLFLMITRYIQEQSSYSILDPGALLLGFLDFFGNHFDPRATGISIRRKEYFSRQSYDQVAISQHNQQQQQHQFVRQHPMLVPTATTSTVLPKSLDSSIQTTLQSVAEKGNNNLFHNFRGASPNTQNKNGCTTSTKPPRIQNRHPNNNNSKFHSSSSPQTTTSTNPQSQDYVQSGRPYKFDPLFVEDPLSAGNNVGRNAFRIFQVKRAFADAYSAIMASLDWDMSSELNYDSDYPLLKCLLHSEDVFHGMDEIR